MQRYVPSLAVLLGLMVFGGLAVQVWLNPPTAGSLSAALLIFGLLIIVGAVITLALAVRPKKDEAEAKKPGYFLSDNLSNAIFLGLIAFVAVAFLLLRTAANEQVLGYIPQLNAEAEVFGVALPELTLALGAAGAVIVLTLLTAGGLAFGLQALGGQVKRLEEAEAAAAKAAKAAAAEAAKTAPKPASAPKPAPAPAAPKPETPKIFLGDDRSTAIFLAVIAIGTVIFLLLRTAANEQVLGYIPQASNDNVLFTIPGTPLKGWPEWLPGPGSAVTEFAAALVGIPALLALVGAAGFGLARLLSDLSARVTTLEKTKNAEPAWPAPQLARLEAQLQSALKPGQPVRLNWVDQTIIVIALAILGLLAFWVMPNLSGALVVDQQVQATQIAARWTPTPLPGPTATPLPGLDVLVAALPAGDAARGEQVAVTNACAACHIGAAGATLAGPSWVAVASADGKGIAQHAAERWQASGYTGKAKSAAEYLYEAIVQPNAYVVSGFNAGVMPQNYGATLSAQDLADLIAYLSALQ